MKLGMFAGVAILGLVGTPQGNANPAPSGYYFLELEGVKTGFLKSFAGGGAVATVPSGDTAATYASGKKLGVVRQQPITLQLGLDLHRSVYDWIAQFWGKQVVTKSGAIVFADSTLKVFRRLEFTEARLIETTFPTLDKADNQPAYITLTLSPQSTRWVMIKGTLAAPVVDKKKTWLASGFRVEIAGLDTHYVRRVDGFTVKAGAAAESYGSRLLHGFHYGKFEFSNLKLTFLESGAQRWFDWHESFVVKAKATDDRKKQGLLRLVSPQTLLLTITFHDAGILSVGHEPPAADKLPRAAAEIFVERMGLSYGSDGAGGAVPAQPVSPAPALKGAPRR